MVFKSMTVQLNVETGTLTQATPENKVWGVGYTPSRPVRLIERAKIHNSAPTRRAEPVANRPTEVKSFQFSTT